MTTASRRAAIWAAGLDRNAIPTAIADAAGLHLLDTLGCGLAARGLDEVPFAAATGADTAPGPATTIGVTPGRAPEEAALVNGTFFHALDFDDTHADSIVHVSAVVVAAALAAAEGARGDGTDLLCALIAGNEVATRIGMAAGGSFHRRGYHPTSLCGIFGATVAAGRAANVDAETIGHALGIAGSMTSGTMEFLADGAKTKPIHAGWAAHAALMAVRLASFGATGPGTTFEGVRGLFGAYLYGEEVEIDGLFDDLGEIWETSRIAYKPFPACHYTHAGVDATAELMAAEGLEADEVEAIVGITDATGLRVVGEPLESKLRPQTPYAAKFSLPYCIAAQLVHGELGVASFSAEAIADPEVLALAALATAESRQYGDAPDAFPGGVRIRTKDGRTLEAELRHQRGSAENPMADADVVAKYREGARLALGVAEVEAVERAALQLDGLDDLTPFAVLGNAVPMRTREPESTNAG